MKNEYIPEFILRGQTKKEKAAKKGEMQFIRLNLLSKASNKARENILDTTIKKA